MLKKQLKMNVLDSRFLFDWGSLFLKNKHLTSMTVSNAYGTVSLSRENGKDSVCTVGFSENNYSDYVDEPEYDCNEIWE